MKQCNSSKDFYKEGTTLLNCKFAVSEFIEDIASVAKAKGFLWNHEEEYFKRFSNSAKSLSILSNVLDRMNINNILPIHTRYGNIIKIAEGFSKMALIVETETFEKFVIKFDKCFDKTVLDKCKTFKELRHETSEKESVNQTAIQAETYDRMRDNKEIGNLLLPIFRYYKRYNCIIEPFVPFIGSLRECTLYTNEDYNTLYDIFKKYGFWDICNGNPGNCGIVNGHVVALDYAL